jgi:hypothetical protein
MAGERFRCVGPRRSINKGTVAGVLVLVVVVVVVGGVLGVIQEVRVGVVLFDER